MTIRRVVACMDVVPPSQADHVEYRVRAILGGPPRGAHRTLVPRGAALRRGDYPALASVVNFRFSALTSARYPAATRWPQRCPGCRRERRRASAMPCPTQDSRVIAP